MFTKTLLILLGYSFSNCSAKEDRSHFNYQNTRIKESCGSWSKNLVCYDQSHSIFASDRLTNNFSFEFLFNQLIVLQTSNRQKNFIFVNTSFRDIHRGANVLGIKSKSELIKYVFQSAVIEEFRNTFSSRKLLIGNSLAVGNPKLNVTKTVLSYMFCAKLEEHVSSLFIRSSTLFNYVGSRNLPTKIILHRTSARIVDTKIVSTISNAKNIFNFIEQIFSNCIPFQGKETIFLTYNSILWFKVGEPYRFKHLPGVFHNRSSFFKLTPQLQEELARTPGLISVQFMTFDSIVRFSYKNFVSVSQLMLLSIKRGDTNLKNLSVPVDLFFKYKIDSKSEQYFNGKSHLPPNHESLLDKDNLVSVYKLMPFHFPGSGKILVTFYNLQRNSLKVSISPNIQPDWESMALDSTIVSTESPVFEAALENQNKEVINYLGIISASTISRTVEYSFEVRYFQCYSKFGIEWKSEGCDVGAQTNETTIHCQCRHLSLFGGGVAIAPRQIDFKQDFKFLHNINENPQACILVSSIILIYFIVLVWTRHNDSKDRLQRFVVVLDDNFPGEEWPYLLTVYTSFSIGSGTEAKVGVRLYGTKGISRVHTLNNLGQRKVLKANCDDWFLIFTHKNLGEIEKIHVFSDFTGLNPDWYCKKMIIYDLEGQKEFKFIIERWVSLSEEEECVDFFCHPTATKKSLRRDRIAMDNIIFGLQETHLLFSIFTRHPRSSVTRSQRLSICICILLVHLLTSNIFHETELPESPQYSETKRKLVIQMESTLVASPFTFIVIFCFKKSRIITAPKNENVPMTLTSTQPVPLETGLEINQSKVVIPQNFENLTGEKKELKEATPSLDGSEEENYETDDEMGEEEEEEVEEEEKEVEEGCLKNCYKQIRALVFQVIISKTIMPVKIAEEDEKSARIRIKWMYFAWFLCEFAIFGSAFFVVIYSLKMKYEVCSEWMQSSMKYSLTNIFFMAPLKITVFALILAGLYGQLHYIPSYECNTEAAVKRKLVGNKKFLTRLLAIRKHKFYKPINSKKTQEIRFGQKIWRRWKILTNFCVIVLCFLSLLLEVELSYHGLYTATENHYHKMFNPRLARKPIKNYQTYIDYLTNVVIPAYDQVNWYNGAPILTQKIWMQRMSYLKDYTTRVVGVPRLRQQRVKPQACVMPSALVEKLDFQQCYASITWSNIDKQSYSVGWAKGDKFAQNSNSPWDFSDLGNSPLIVCGHVTAKCYMPGGYTAKLDFKASQSKSIVNSLMEDEWFDGLTRVLYFETVVYNVNSDIISSISPMLEKLADGSFFIHLKSTSLHSHVEDFVATLLILLFFISYFCIRIVLLFNRKGLKYLLSLTCILDVLLGLLMFATTASLFLNSSARTEYLKNWQLQEENDLQITTGIFLHRSLMKYELCMLLVLVPIQLLHNFRFGKRYFNCFKALSYCSKYAFGIALITGFFFTCSVLLSAIYILKPVQCLYNRSYSPITYCKNLYSLAYHVEFFTFIFWFLSNIATVIVCVTTVYGYKWTKEQNKYADDFNMVAFLLGRLSQSRGKIIKILFRARRMVTNLSPKRMRAGADVVDDEIHPRNTPLSYTKIMSNEMNMKLDTILEKLRDLETSF